MADMSNSAQQQDLVGMDLLMNAKSNAKRSQISDAISVLSSGSEHSRRSSRNEAQPAKFQMFEDDASSSDAESLSASSVSRRSRRRPGKDEKKSKEEDVAAKPDDYWTRKPRSEADATNMKRELLYEFERMRIKGYKLPRVYTMDMPLDEIQAEYVRLRKDRELDSGVMFQRQILITCVTGLEFLSSVSPFDCKLDGWSHHVNDHIDSYDDVLEELYLKYRGSAKMAPELRLMMALGGSAVMFSMQNRMASMAESFMRGSAAGQRSPGGGGAGGGIMGGIGSLIGSLFGAGAGPAQPAQAQAQAPAQAQTQSERPFHQSATPMQGPSLNVENVLKNLQHNAFDRLVGDAADNNRVEIISTISDLSDIPDDASIMSGATPMPKSQMTSHTRAKGRRTLNLSDL
jgi:hypothetical protein